MAAAAPAPLRRLPEGAPLAGVCAGLAADLRVDATLLRIGFVAAAAAGGVGLVAYAVCWLLIPAEGAGAPGMQLPRLRTRPGSIKVAAGIGLLVLSALLLLRHLGLWFGDSLVWPLALAVTGAALIWRQTAARTRPPLEADARPWAAVSGAEAPAPTAALDTEARSRVLLGAALVLGGGLLLAPFWVRLVRGLAAERAERIRTQERAEVAAHLHDSVLQTLALVQRHAGDPRAVASLARRQERELRAWLNGEPAPGTRRTLQGALQQAAADVEDAHAVTIDLVAVGDRPLDERTEALAAAAREALTNAAKFAGDGPISLYAEVSGDRVQVFVRDRGTGFDLAAVPADRRGLRESIMGRMERHGGRAHVHTGESGTEVELTL